MSYTVIIVDDSGYSRTTLRVTLKEAGYDVLDEAKNGNEALDKILKLRPDLVTLDNILPDMTGLQILQKIKEQGVESKVVMISAVGQQSAIEEGFDLGAEAYIIKPFTKDILLSEIEKVLRK